MSIPADEQAPILDDNGYVVEDRFYLHSRSNITLDQIDDLQKRFGVVIHAPRKR